MMRRRYEYMGDHAPYEGSLWYRVYYMSTRAGACPSSSGWLVHKGEISTPGEGLLLSVGASAAYREMTWCTSAPVWTDVLEFV